MQHFCETNFYRSYCLLSQISLFILILAYPTLLPVNFPYFSHWDNIIIDCFQEIFTPPESQTPEYDPMGNVLNQIRQMEDGGNERRDAHARQFINQFQEVHEEEQGAVGGQAPSQVPLQPTNPANVQIVNEYNSFNLANITLPIVPNRSILITCWMNSTSLNSHVRGFVMAQCAISQVAKSRPACY